MVGLDGVAVTTIAATETGSKAARALDGLYRAHVAEIYRYTYAVLGNRADAEDVTQTTFVNALRALERGERPRNPSNWLIAIAHNIVRQRFRQQQARPIEVELDSDRVEAHQADDTSPTMDELVRALQRLVPAQREALVLREFEGRSYKEIQELLGLTAGAVETLLFRARRSLAEELDNLVTCERAELAMSKQSDGRLSRKERRRLDAHLHDCPSCAHLDGKQSKYRRAFKGLALLPLPLSLTLFKGTPSAAAAGLSTIGAGAAVAGGASVGAAGGTAGGVAAGGVIAKIAVVVAAVSVAGGFGYEGVKQVQQHVRPNRPAKARNVVTTRGNRSGVARRTALHGSKSAKASNGSNGKALLHKRGSSHSSTGQGRRTPAAPGASTATPRTAKHAANIPAAVPRTATVPSRGSAKAGTPVASANARAAGSRH